jgi:hypothetical protein
MRCTERDVNGCLLPETPHSTLQRESGETGHHASLAER